MSTKGWRNLPGRRFLPLLYLRNFKPAARSSIHHEYGAFAPALPAAKRAPGQRLSDSYFVGNWLRQLVDELNDATGAGLDQHGAAVHDRVVVAPRAAIFGRNVVIADSGLGQDRTNCEGLRIRVRRHLLTNDIFGETRSIIDAQNAGNPAGH